MSIVVFSNPDKKAHEKFYEGRDLMDIPCPARVCLISRPNGGKSNTILNILLKAKPHFQKIFLSHPALKATEGDCSDIEDEYDDVVQEYKHVDYTPLFEFPNPKFFDNGCTKQCLICDDLDIKNLSKEQRRRFGKILSYSSTHYNLTVLVSFQCGFSQMPVYVARFTSMVCLWRYNDLNYMRMILNRFGVGSKQLEAILEEMKNYGVHDMLVIDFSDGTPHKYRRNGYIPVLQNLEN
jgi:hypothetical protein